MEKPVFSTKISYLPPPRNGRELIIRKSTIIDNVMTAAMIAGAQNNKTTIDSEVMLAAINEQSLV